MAIPLPQIKPMRRNRPGYADSACRTSAVSRPSSIRESEESEVSDRGFHAYYGTEKNLIEIHELAQGLGVRIFWSESARLVPTVCAPNRQPRADSRHETRP